MKTKPIRKQELFSILDGMIEQGGRQTCYCALIAVLYAVGGRISEVIPLRRRDILRPDGSFRNTITRVKLKTKANVPPKITRSLNEAIIPYIQPWLVYQRNVFGRGRAEDFIFDPAGNGKHIHRSTAWKICRRLFSPFTDRPGTHTPRKTFATIMYSAWLGELKDPIKAARQVQKLLGHASLETTWNYLGLDDQDPELMLDAISPDGQQYQLSLKNTQ